ncbi:hypothetical protein FB45DRAFT_862090 [Roridomyces roridus]|uniref:Uncharacterized protein n=1 Tax=Roridomyces roridus TaxID=1738132 RepID=A0AAD7CCP7_9AGAR|nr:hypothetical protein FB45DRAFT_862090 [Roridomyces roridus]
MTSNRTGASAPDFEGPFKALSMERPRTLGTLSISQHKDRMTYIHLNWVEIITYKTRNPVLYAESPQPLEGSGSSLKIESMMRTITPFSFRTLPDASARGGIIASNLGIQQSGDAGYKVQRTEVLRKNVDGADQTGGASTLEKGSTVCRMEVSDEAAADVAWPFVLPKGLSKDTNGTISTRTRASASWTLTQNPIALEDDTGIHFERTWYNVGVFELRGEKSHEFKEISTEY